MCNTCMYTRRVSDGEKKENATCVVVPNRGRSASTTYSKKRTKTTENRFFSIRIRAADKAVGTYTYYIHNMGKITAWYEFCGTTPMIKRVRKSTSDTKFV